MLIPFGQKIWDNKEIRYTINDLITVQHNVYIGVSHWEVRAEVDLNQRVKSARRHVLQSVTYNNVNATMSVEKSWITNRLME